MSDFKGVDFTLERWRQCLEVWREQSRKDEEAWRELHEIVRAICAEAGEGGPRWLTWADMRCNRWCAESGSFWNGSAHQIPFFQEALDRVRAGDSPPTDDEIERIYDGARLPRFSMGISYDGVSGE